HSPDSSDFVNNSRNPRATPDDAKNDIKITLPTGEGDDMSDHTYRVIEIVGTSPDGTDAAIRNGLARAAETTRGLDWFEVESVRGHLENGAVAHFQVTLKVGFRLEDA
ncbi:MAG: dodecin, partial [Pseudonocardiaceae bacterium]